MAPTSPLAAVVLAGGRSSRMGTPKAEIDWFGSPLVFRTVSILGRVADPIVVVRAPGQELPDLPQGTIQVEDAAEGRGPLEGLAAGMRALDGVTAAFVSSTDVPMLHPEFVRSVADGLGDADVALPVVGGHNHPLSSVYRLALLPKVESLLVEDRLRPAFVWEDGTVATLEEDRLAYPDSVRNVNTPEELAEARALPQPLVQIDAFGIVRTKLGAASTQVRAATLGAALAQLPDVGLDPEHLLVALNGERFRSDPRLPLVEGDRLSLLPAEAGG